MNLLFALPGFHRFDRGAEVALLAVADACARAGDNVTVMGSGQVRPGAAYDFVHVPAISRERFEGLPSIPLLRGDTAYEEATFMPGLAMRYRPSDYHVTITCSFPFTNLLLRRPSRGGRRPRHVFVTQNGDWPAVERISEYRLFSCDGLVCTNPDFLARNRDRWRCVLIPNGTDTARFAPGGDERARFGLPAGVPLVLMVSALIPSKRVLDGINAVAAAPGAHLVVAGDGALREEVDALATERLSGRFSRLTVAPADMPALYRSADVFLHLSRLESFGNVFVEAMACGLPIVGHDSPRLRWIVGDDEHLVGTDDLGAVTAALLAATSGSATVGMRRRVERAGRFDWSAIGFAYRQFFADLCV